MIGRRVHLHDLNIDNATRICFEDGEQIAYNHVTIWVKESAILI